MDRLPRLEPVLEWILLVPRALFGAMFVATGTGWLLREARGEYLASALAGAPSLEPPVGLYGRFLSGVVLEYPDAFSLLVGVGELLCGLALLSGFPRRVGAAGAVFLVVNYGVAFGSPILPPGGNFLLALTLLPLLSGRAYRRVAWTPPARGAGEDASPRR